MTEERITETETPSGNVHTTHTIVTNDTPRSGGGTGWIVAVVVLIAAIAAFYLFSQQTGAETAKDNAVEQAAQDVGAAAKDVGEAAKKAVDGE